MKKALGVIGAMGLILTPMVAMAHNAGHFTLPDGTCRQVGSSREAPLVGPDRTQLDLVPQTPLPRDEYGTSFVGFGGGTPLLPGPCPAVQPAAASAEGGGTTIISTSGWW
jgi:hypothetical protein